jgi:uncharacterized membrane protein YeiH
MTTKPPKIFKPGHLKVRAAFIGLVLYVLALHFGAPANLTGGIAIVFIFVLRVVNRDNDWTDSAKISTAQPADVPAQIPKHPGAD